MSESPNAVAGEPTQAAPCALALMTACERAVTERRDTCRAGRRRARRTLRRRGHALDGTVSTSPSIARVRRANGLCAAGALLALAAASAASAADRLAPLLACRALGEDATRLACFDRESAALAGGGDAAKLSPEQKFGLGAATVVAKEAEPGQPPAGVAALEGTLTGLRTAADGRVVFTLDNGQVWRQLAPGPDLLLKVGDRVKIARGVFDSYLLTTPAMRNCKVTRVR
jgi:hypothetical protein